MEQSEMLWIASIAVAKNYDYETLNYSDYMYDKEEYTDEVYEYVTECREIGKTAFYEQYKEFNLY